MVGFLTQLHIIKGVFHLRIVFNCSNTKRFFFLDKQFQVFVFIILFKFKLKKNVWNIMGKKVICSREMKKKPKSWKPYWKKIGPTNKYRDITFVTLPAEKMEDVILISGYQI